MNVFDNLAFPLVCRNWDKDKITSRVESVAEILGISNKLNRQPGGSASTKNSWSRWVAASSETTSQCCSWTNR